MVLSMLVQIGEQLKKMPNSNSINPYAQLVEDAEGLDKIETLQVRAMALQVWLVHGSTGS